MEAAAVLESIRPVYRLLFDDAWEFVKWLGRIGGEIRVGERGFLVKVLPRLEVRVREVWLEYVEGSVFGTATLYVAYRYSRDGSVHSAELTLHGEARELPLGDEVLGRRMVLVLPERAAETLSAVLTLLLNRDAIVDAVARELERRVGELRRIGDMLSSAARRLCAEVCSAHRVSGLSRLAALEEELGMGGRR